MAGGELQRWLRWWFSALCMVILGGGIAVGTSFALLAGVAREASLLRVDLRTQETWRIKMDQRFERLLTSIEYADENKLAELRSTIEAIRLDMQQDRRRDAGTE